MSLYIPSQFRSENPEAALALIRAEPFATLITSVAGQEPHITHLPLLLEEGEAMRSTSSARSMAERPATDGRAGPVDREQPRQGRHGGSRQWVLSGHMARANPHWQAFARGHTVAVFHGPHAYISPRWYVNPAREVPTWNFATVHVHGQPTVHDDAAIKLSVVDASSAVFEPAENPWQRQLDAARVQSLMDAIVVFHIPLTRLEAKFKMNQNKTPQDRAQVIAGLRASRRPDALATADWMQADE